MKMVNNTRIQFWYLPLLYAIWHPSRPALTSPTMSLLNFVVNVPPSNGGVNLEGVVIVSDLLRKMNIEFGPRTYVFKMRHGIPRPFDDPDSIAAFINNFHSTEDQRLRSNDYIVDLFPPGSIDRNYVHILILGTSHFLSLRPQLSH